jgi:hypothetical protein
VLVSGGDSTLRHVLRAHEGPAPRWGRRLGIAVLLVVVAVGAIGGFGVRSRTVRAEQSGYTLQVTYPQTARAGLDVPWRARVHRAGGFSSDLTLAISTDYFRMFETQGFYPDADSVTNDGRFVYLTFTKPTGDDFVLDYDAYIQPGSQLGKSATVEVMVGGVVMVRATLRTWLLP